MRTGARTLVLAVFALPGFALAYPGRADPTPATHVVEVRQLRFQPDTLTVAPGDTVVWINRDIVPHTVTAVDGEWRSDEMEQDGTWRRVAPQGSGQYYCEYHPTMRGIVIVEGE